MGRTPEREVLVVAEVGASVPCRADAERAAAALADAGVGRVVLFGSVARGKATIRSDIDLVAIYDDLDYRRRDQSQDELSALARAAAGHPVDVIVTDRPEWKIRTEQVTTSVESRAARSGVVLVDRKAVAEVNWGKEMVAPTSDHAEAVERLAETTGTACGQRGPGVQPFRGQAAASVRRGSQDGRGFIEVSDTSQFRSPRLGMGTRHRQAVRAVGGTPPQRRTSAAGSAGRRRRNHMARTVPVPDGSTVCSAHPGGGSGHGPYRLLGRYLYGWTVRPGRVGRG